MGLRDVQEELTSRLNFLRDQVLTDLNNVHYKLDLLCSHLAVTDDKKTVTGDPRELLPHQRLRGTRPSGPVKPDEYIETDELLSNDHYGWSDQELPPLPKTPELNSRLRHANAGSSQGSGSSPSVHDVDVDDGDGLRPPVSKNFLPRPADGDDEGTLDDLGHQGAHLPRPDCELDVCLPHGTPSNPGDSHSIRSRNSVAYGKVATENDNRVNDGQEVKHTVDPPVGPVSERCAPRIGVDKDKSDVSMDVQFTGDIDNKGRGESKFEQSKRNHSTWSQAPGARSPSEYLQRRAQNAPKLYALHPDGYFRRVIDVAGFMVVTIEVITLPIAFAWELVMAAEWGVRIFWTIDTLLNVVTGHYTKDYHVEIRLRQSAWFYLSGWFLFDLVVVCCEWIFGALAPQRNHVLQTIPRTLRLLRAMRQGKRYDVIWQKMKLFVVSKELNLVLDTLRLLTVIVLVNHVVACLWFWLGQQTLDASDTGKSWLSDEHLQTDKFSYQYATSLHWAMTQVTPGSMEVFPNNSAERVYNIICLVGGLILSTSLIAALSSMMTQYRLSLQNYSRNEAMLQAYLSQEHVNQSLRYEIVQQAQTHMKVNKVRLKEQDIEFLKMASTEAQDKLRHFVVMKTLSSHIFLNTLNAMDMASMRSFCKNAIESQHMEKGEHIFVEGIPAEGMYFVAHGHVQYTPGELAPEFLWADDDSRFSLQDGAWCAEVGLWAIWNYLGNLVAQEAVEMMSLSVDSLKKEAVRFPNTTLKIFQQYRTTFHSFLNEPGCIRSDLSYAIDYYELISCIPREARMKLAEPVLDQLHMGVRGALAIGQSADDKMDLYREVEAGKCNVSLIGEEVVRTVFVIVLRIRLGGDRRSMLVKMGEINIDGDGSYSTSTAGQLPGTKRTDQENLVAAANRLLNQDFSSVKDSCQINVSGEREHEVVLKSSEKYRIRTRYLRTILQAELEPDFSHESVPLNFGGVKVHTNFFQQRLRREATQHALRVLEEKDHATVILNKGKHGTKHDVYLWLTDSEFAALSGQDNLLAEWMKHVAARQQALRAGTLRP